jgi:hypothetical protein
MIVGNALLAAWHGLLPFWSIVPLHDPLRGAHEEARSSAAMPPRDAERTPQKSACATSTDNILLRTVAMVSAADASAVKSDHHDLL